MDDLNYSNYDGNRLKAVGDTGTPQGFADGNTSGNDYGYDANGNLTQDLNKGISAIDYNLLNLPATINFADGRQIIYVYDASGNKLDQEVTENGATSTTHYAGPIQYTTDDAGLTSTNFLSTSEGRAVPNLASGDWDNEYFLKDHLGNTRVSVGTETDTLTFSATMEAANATEEETYFKNLPETRHQDALYNHTSGGSYTSWLNGAQGRIAGPAIALQVHPGDTVNIEVFAQYAIGTGNNPEIVGNLTAAVAASFGWVSTAPETNYIFDFFDDVLGGAPLFNSSNDDIPKAYLNYLLFDKNFNFLDFGYQQVSTAANGAFEKLDLQVENITEAGYIYIYVANESNVDLNVFFDDLKVDLIQSPVTNWDYYPFGMVNEQLSNRFDKPGSNKYLYNGNELQGELGLNLYDFNKRFYDAVLGRFTSVDSLADHPKQLNQSPYQYAWNNPIKLNDPKGDCPACPWIDAVVDVGFVLYDAGEIAYDFATTGEVDPVSVAALGADAASIFVPMSVGAGMAVRAGAKSVKAADNVRDAANAAENTIDVTKQIGPAGDAGGTVMKQLPEPMQNFSRTTNSGRGTIFKDPQNPSGNNVRVETGNPKSPNPRQQVDYVKQVRGGKMRNKKGKQVDPKSEESHIPKEEFKFEFNPLFND